MIQECVGDKMQKLIDLRNDILAEIDGGDECRGRDSQLSDWARRIDEVVAAMPDAMKLLEEYHEALVNVVAEAKEHWPDAESWPIIEELTALLEE